MPEHLRPFVGSTAWRMLTAPECLVSFAIIGMRRACSKPTTIDGLFFTLDLGADWTEDEARDTA